MAKKEQSRIASLAWMVITIAGISGGLYWMTAKQVAATEESVLKAPACSVASIAVDKLRGNSQHITGRLANNCDLAVGAQIKITTYDKADNILSVDDIWPASISNIPAHSKFLFEWMPTGAARLSTFTVEVTRVKTWKN